MSACASWSAIGRRRSRPTISSGDGSRCAGRARRRHGARRAGGQVRRPCRSGLAGARLSRSRSARSRHAGRRRAGTARARSRGGRARRHAASANPAAPSASAGIGGMVLVTSHGFHGATLGSRHSISMAAIAGNGTGMEQDYDFSSTLHAADLEAADKVGRTAGERAVERLNPRKVATRRVPVVFDARISGSLVDHLASAANGASVARKTSFLREKLGAADFRVRHRHHRRSVAQARAALAARSTPRASPPACSNWSRTACSRPGFSTAPPPASLICKPPATPSAAFPRCPRPVRAISISAPGTQKPRRTDRRHRGRLLCHRSDRLGRQYGDRRL